MKKTFATLAALATLLAWAVAVGQDAPPRGVEWVGAPRAVNLDGEPLLAVPYRAAPYRAAPERGASAIAATFSADDGRTWAPASGSVVAGRYLWRAATDLGPEAQARARLRLAAAGGQATTEAFAWAGDPEARTLRRYPFVQQVTSEQAVIVFETRAAVDAAVRFGPTPAVTRTVATPRGRRHEARLEGLAAGSRVYYQVVAAGESATPCESFRTAPAAGAATGFTFAVVGDSGKGSDAQYRVAEQLRRVDPSFVLHTGDVIYPSGAKGDYQQKFFDPYRDVARGAPFFLSLGNHDILTWLGTPYVETFVLPESRPGGERYYAVEWGEARLLALDSSKGFFVPRSKQWTWLKGQLARPRPRWLFVFFHHPPYSAGQHGSNRFVRAAIAPLLEAGGVDAVFNGHDHDYQRSHPISDYGGDGTVYFVSGGGGAGLRDVGTEDFTAVSAKRHHLLKVDVTHDAVRVTAIADDGAVIDETALSPK